MSTTNNLHPKLPEGNPLNRLLNSMTLDEISRNPALSAVYFYEMSELTGIPLEMITRALMTGDYSEMEELTGVVHTPKVVDLPKDYWQTFKDDAISQAEELLGGEL